MNSRNMISTGRYESIVEKLKTIEPLVMGPNSFQLELQPLSPASETKAERELRETAEIIDQAFIDIRKCLKEEIDLAVPDDDYFLAKFLRANKWHVKPAIELMKRYYRFRVNHPRYCADLVPRNEGVVFTSPVLTPLPLRAKDGCRVILLQGGRIWKPKEVSVDQIFRGNMTLIDFVAEEPETQVNGIHYILDMDGFSLSQVTYFTPSYAAAVVEYAQSSLPIRCLKGIHIIRQPFIFNMVFALFRPFIQEKMRKRIHFHGTNTETLKSYIGAEALPKQYGGDMELTPVSGDSFWNYLCHFNEEYDEAAKFGFTKKVL